MAEAEADDRFLEQMYDRFQTRVRKTTAERDWERVRLQFLAYGLFLEQEASNV